jgi:regulator of PEP synthase PpsR (kinase-PPPase family)
MESERNKPPARPSSRPAGGETPVYVVSGGLGISGEHVVRAALAQFGRVQVPVTVVPNVTRMEQLEAVMLEASKSRSTIVHTFVDPDLRRGVTRLGYERNQVVVDVLGPLLSRFATVLGKEPMGQPGLYGQLREASLRRVEAIDFALAHDDGRNPQDLHLAEMIILGVSRVGKTPLSMYLAVHGWKVANSPFVKGIALPAELFAVDPRRVIGLDMDPSQLLEHRLCRRQRLGIGEKDVYFDPGEIEQELKTARRLYHQKGFCIVDITNQSIEETAEEIIAMVGPFERP